jgi:hypothetical protein
MEFNGTERRNDRQKRNNFLEEVYTKLTHHPKHPHKYLVSHFASGTPYAVTEIRSLSFFTYFTEIYFTT